MVRFVTLIGIAVLVCAPARGEWRQFRGPNGQGNADARGLPVDFSESRNVAWKTAIPGRGWSSPVVLGKQVWLTTALNDGHSLRAVCVDRDSGRIVHNVEVFAPEKPVPVNSKNSYASPSPVIEPGRVYVHFGAMGTACLATDTADILWRCNELVIDHKEGPGSSPILFENLLIVNCDGQDAQYVAALDKDSGQIIWKTRRSGPLRSDVDLRKAYSTPVTAARGNEQQVVSTGADQVEGYDPRTGKELWRIRYQGFSNVPIPLAQGNMLYVCTGYTSPELWGLRSDGSGDVTDSHVVWKFARQVPANTSPLLANERIYMVSNGGVVSCVKSADGKPVWQQRLAGNYSASPVFADGRLYFSSEEGKVTALASQDKFRVLSVNQLEGRLMATPAIDGHALYFRTDTHLYRIEDLSGGRQQ